MLGKLIKHEFLAIARLLAPAYLIIMVLALIGRFLTWISSKQYVIDNIPPTFAKLIKGLSTTISGLYVFIFFALIAFTFLFMAYRFYKNYFTDEGYLMMTLPTKPTSLIFSKLLNSWIWMIFSIAVAALALYITLGHFEQLRDLVKQMWDAIGDVINREGDYLRQELGVPLWFFACELVLLVLAIFTSNLVSLYASIAFGQLISKKHKIAGFVLAFLILYFVSQVLSFAYLGIVTSVMPDYIDALNQSAGKALQATIIGVGSLDILFSAAMYAFTAYIMRHKLNID